jgi:hypothetical protein
MPFKKPLWTIVAWALWGAVLAVLLLRAGLHPARPTSLTTYLTGGAAWSGAQALYTNWRGFVYPPVVAWFFSLFARMPLTWAAVLWRMLAAGTFLVGLGAVLRSGVFHRIPAAYRGIVFLGVLPLSIGNIDNAQANPLIAGLMMLSVAALQWEAWTVCAVAIGVATTFKIYPVALALLLCVLRPRQLWWRIALVLLVLGVLPFALQEPGYVSGQYHAWMQSRLADDRFHYPMKDAPLDLWYLLVRLGNLPLSPRVYTVVQVLAGAGIAGGVWTQSRRGVDLRDVLAELFLFVSVWMILLGPATENQTYVVLGPAACLVAVEALSESRFSRAYRGAERGGEDRDAHSRMGQRPMPTTLARGTGALLGLAAFGLLLAGVARNSLLPHLKSPLFMAIQPAGALVLLAAILVARREATPASPR